MKRTFAIAVVLLASGAREARADVSLGANFGATIRFQEHDDGRARVALGWPYSQAAGPTPGIRFGFAGDRGNHEGYLDSTFSFYSRRSERALLLTGNYQYNFNGHANTMFVTGGAGPIIYGHDDFEDYVAFMFGGGFGFRQRIAQGHGTFREEFRFDFIPGSSRYPQTFMLGVKLGFDLWFR
jgi:hypothetical protein